MCRKGHPLFQAVKENKTLNEFSEQIRPQKLAFTDQAESFRRNLLWILAIISFVVLAILILFYQLSTRPLVAASHEVDIRLEIDEWNVRKWDTEVVQDLITKLDKSERDDTGGFFRCSCAAPDIAWYAFLPLNESRVCEYVMAEANLAEIIPSSKLSQWCNLLGEMVSIPWSDGARLPASSEALTPQAWLYALRTLYTSTCAQTITTFIYQSISDQLTGSSSGDLMLFTEAVEEDLLAYYWFCRGFVFDASEYPNLLFLHVLNGGYKSPDFLSNRDSNGNIMNTTLYESYLAYYCVPNLCTQYETMSVTQVLINTLGTVASVFTLLILAAAMLYRVVLARKHRNLKEDVYTCCGQNPSVPDEEVPASGPASGVLNQPVSVPSEAEFTNR